MGAPVIYWAGGEDSDCFQSGGGVVVTSTSTFRNTYARCSLGVTTNNNGGASTCFWQNYLPFSLSTFWFGAQHTPDSINVSSGNVILKFSDTGGILRLRMQSAGVGLAGFYKVNAAGSATQLGANFNFNMIANAPLKVDVFINDAVSGTVTVYVSGVKMFTFSGDTTTDSVSTLTSFGLGGARDSSGKGYWSEIILSDSDTRSFSLQTLAPTINGNSHSFDTGTPAAANVNEITLNDATYDGSSVAAQVDQYHMTALAAGSYSILAVGMSTRAQKGFSGPANLDNGLRSSGADYWAADHALGTAFANYQDWWNADPATAAAWAALPSNIGLRSVT